MKKETLHTIGYIFLVVGIMGILGSFGQSTPEARIASGIGVFFILIFYGLNFWSKKIKNGKHSRSKKHS